MSGGSVYGMVADAGADIFWGNGISPLAKWVDDHIFFRLPHEHLPDYNACRAIWHSKIQSLGGRMQDGSRLWYKGKDLPDGSPEEFDEDCTTTLWDFAHTSPRTAEDHLFAYADTDIDVLSSCLGIWWETSKSVPFVTAVPYLGFRWDLCTQVVHLLEEKKIKYLTAIAECVTIRTRFTSFLTQPTTLHVPYPHDSS